MIPKLFLLPALLAAALATGILSSAAGERQGEHPGDRDGDHDEDRARAALEAGRILPLSDILERARRDGGGGRLLDVELEHRHGDNGDPGGNPGGGAGEEWIYELKMLAPGGAVLGLDYDARTGRLLRIRRPESGRGDGKG